MLTDSLLMTPSKSVTAVMGVSPKPHRCEVRAVNYVRKQTARTGEDKGYDRVNGRNQEENRIFRRRHGKLLQANGLKPGELPETWNILHPEIVTKLHYDYLEAGATSSRRIPLEPTG